MQGASVDSARVFACSVDARSLAEVGASPISVLASVLVTIAQKHALVSVFTHSFPFSLM
jgi:hypothetical protein